MKVALVLCLFTLMTLSVLSAPYDIGFNDKENSKDNVEQSKIKLQSIFTFIKEQSFEGDSFADFDMAKEKILDLLSITPHLQNMVEDIVKFDTPENIIKLKAFQQGIFKLKGLDNLEVPDFDFLKSEESITKVFKTILDLKLTKGESVLGGHEEIFEIVESMVKFVIDAHINVKKITTETENLEEENTGDEEAKETGYKGEDIIKVIKNIKEINIEGEIIQEDNITEEIITEEIITEENFTGEIIDEDNITEENIQEENIQVKNIQVENIHVENIQVENIQVENIEEGNLEEENIEEKNTKEEDKPKEIGNEGEGEKDDVHQDHLNKLHGFFKFIEQLNLDGSSTMESGQVKEKLGDLFSIIPHLTHLDQEVEEFDNPDMEAKLEFFFNQLPNCEGLDTFTPPGFDVFNIGGELSGIGSGLGDTRDALKKPFTIFGKLSGKHDGLFKIMDKIINFTVDAHTKGEEKKDQGNPLPEHTEKFHGFLDFVKKLPNKGSILMDSVKAKEKIKDIFSFYPHLPDLVNQAPEYDTPDMQIKLNNFIRYLPIEQIKDVLKSPNIDLFNIGGDVGDVFGGLEANHGIFDHFKPPNFDIFNIGKDKGNFLGDFMESKHAVLGGQNQWMFQAFEKIVKFVLSFKKKTHGGFF